MLLKVTSDAYFEQMRVARIEGLWWGSCCSIFEQKGLIYPFRMLLSLHVLFIVFLIGATDEDQITDYR
jgi:hypothetical protein